MFKQRAPQSRQQTLKLEIVDDLGLKQRHEERFVGERCGALRAEQFGKPQRHRLGGGKALERRRYGGALLDQHFGAAESERHGLGEMPNRIIPASQRLIGDSDGVVGGGVAAIERQSLFEHFYGELIAATLLHQVGKQYEAAQMLGVSRQYRATQVLRRDEFLVSIVSRNSRINLFDGRRWRKVF
jgi:hypothetical protein